MEDTTGRKFQALKRRLDALHYSQPLDIQSAGLVERLLNDLVRTTEGFQALKKANDQYKALNESEKQLQEPLRRENQRIVQENNQLHMEIIKYKEDAQHIEHKYKLTIQNIESERQDLRFLVDQKDHKIRDQDREIQEVKDKLESVLGKVYMPGGERAGGRDLPPTAMNVIGRPQKIEMTNTFPQESEREIVSSKDEYTREQKLWAEELRNADQRAEKYRNDLTQINRESEQLADNLAQTQDQVLQREQEIMRLQALFEGGQNMDKLTINYVNKANQDTVSKLNSHIDFLNKDNHRLNTELSKFKFDVSRAKNMVMENEGLQNTITHIKEKTEVQRNTIKDMQNTIQMLKTERMEQSEALKHKKLVTLDDLNKEKRRANELEQKLRMTESNLKGLRDEDHRAKQVQSAYNADKRAFSETMDKVHVDQITAQNEKKELIIENEKIRTDLEGSRNDVNVLKGKVGVLERDVEMSEQSIKRLTKETMSNVDESQNFRRRIQDLEQELLQLKSTQTDSHFELERAQRAKMHLEGQMEDMKLQLNRKAGDMETNSVHTNRLEIQLRTLQKEKEYWDKDIRSVEAMAEQHKQESIDAEKRAKEYFSQLSMAQENVKLLQKEQALLTEEISAKLDEIRKLDQQRMNYERELVELRPMREEIVSMNSATNHQLQETLKVEGEKNFLRNKVHELEKELKYRKDMNMDLEERAQKAELDKQKLFDQLRALEIESREIQDRMRKNLEMEREIKLQRETLDNQKLKEATAFKEFEENKRVLRHMEMDKSELENKFDRLIQTEKDLRRDLRERENEITSLRRDIREGYAEKTGLDQKLSQYNLEILDLKQMVGNEQKEKYKYENDFQLCEKELQTEKGRNIILEEQVQSLKGLCANLDNTKEELVERLKGVNQTRRMDESEKQDLMNEIQNLKKDILGKDQHTGNLNISLQEMDSRIDKMQSLLDVKTEELQDIRRKMSVKEEEMDDIKSRSHIQSTKEADYNQRLLEREGEIRDLRAHVNHLQKDLEDTKEALYLRKKEVEELSADVRALSRENEIVNGELSRITRTSNQLKEQHEEISSKERAQMHQLRAHELEKEDILDSYKKVCIECERMKENLTSLNSQQKELLARNNLLEQELDGKDKIAMRLEEGENRAKSQAQILERQITQLTKQLDACGRDLRESQNIQNHLARDMQSSKHMSGTLETVRDDLEREVVYITREKREIEERNREVGIELEALKDQLEHDRVRYSELELILAKERNKQHEQHIDIQNLERENIDFKGEINRLNSRIQSLQNHIETVQKYKSQLSPSPYDH